MEEFKSILSELLGKEELKHPFSVENKSKTYRDDLFERLEIYYESLGKLTTKGYLTKWLKENQPKTKEVNRLIIAAIDEYLKGSAGKAYTHIDKLMNHQFIKTHIRHLKIPLKPFTSKNNSLFRIRASEEFIEKKEEIFHIPFHMRHLIGTQRYSIAGVPCLYLGTSLYVCWQELGRPDLNKLYLSHFKLAKPEEDIHVLNFAYSLETIKTQDFQDFFNDENENYVNRNKAYLVFWPILMASSYDKGNSSAKFVVEYVIPNLIIQWVSREKRPVSGIMYFSTKTKELRQDMIGINVVMPPSTDKLQNEGFCSKLSKYFKFSEPVAWQLLNTIPGPRIQSLSAPTSPGDFHKSFILKYKSTTFYEMEENLKRLMKCTVLSDDN